jgi:hypothetical protein
VFIDRAEQTSHYNKKKEDMAMKTKIALGLVIAWTMLYGGGAFGFYEGTTVDNNAFFGTGAGALNKGLQNTFIGVGAGGSASNYNWNTFVGYAAGAQNGNAAWNTFVGGAAGSKNQTGQQNTMIGMAAGWYNTTGSENTFLGYQAGASNVDANSNTFIGYNAGSNNLHGIANTYIGHDAGFNATGAGNTFIGKMAGFSATTGWRSVMLGELAGYNNVTGGGNVFIGWSAGAQELGSNRLYIDNSNTPTPLIYGEFDTRLLRVDGSLGVGTTPVRQLHVAGPNAVFRMDRTVDTAAFLLVRTSPGGTPLKTFVVGTNASGPNQGEFMIGDMGSLVSGASARRMTITNNGAVEFTGIVSAPAFWTKSSIAFKTNVRTYENALDKVNRLRGVSFEWKETGKPSVGLIAEEVDRVIPEVVAHGGNNGAATGVNYSALVGVLVEAVKEQQAAIAKQQEAISKQNEAIAKQQEINAELREEINRLKSKDLIAQR